jgi:hypothetical protein
MTDAARIVVKCGCGKTYVVAPEKRGKKLRCKKCGGTFIAAEVHGADATASHEDHEASHAAPAHEPAAKAESARPPLAHDTVPPASPGAEAVPAKTAPVPAAVPEPAELPAPPAAATSEAATVARRVEPAAVLAGRLPDQIENPDELMKPLTRGSFPLLLGVAFVGHIVFFGLTSINFIQLCFRYKSLHPMVEVRKELREAEDKRLQEARNKALEKYMPKAAPAPARKNELRDEPRPAAKAEGKAASAPRPKSKVEQATEEKIMERPKEGSNPLEDLKDIE